MAQFPAVPVTPHKAGEEELQRQREWLRVTLTSIGDAVIATDAQGRVTFLNPEAASVTGWNESEAAGQPVTSVFHIIDERTGQPAGDPVGKVLREKKALTLANHTALRRRDGSEVPIEDSAAPIRDAAGEVIGAVLVFHDVTEKRRSQQALTESEKRFHSLFTNMVEGFSLHEVVTDETGRPVDYRFLDVNPAFEQLTGLRREEIIGKRVLEVLPQTEQHWIDTYGKVALTGEACRFENYSAALGRWYEVFAYQPAPLQFAVIFTDITARKAAENELGILNRTLVALRHSSQAMTRAVNEDQYLQEVCKIIIEDCGHAMVWIGFAHDDPGKSVRPVASAGFEQGYLETLQLSWADTPRGRGPTGTAIRSGKPATCRNMQTDPKFLPWRSEAVKRGYASSLVLPLMSRGKAMGAISIYSTLPEGFTDEQTRLLAELADDVSVGISSIRLHEANVRAQEALRQAHDELERRVIERTIELAKATDAAKGERQRLFDVLETLPVYVVLLNRDYYVPFANRFFEENFGKSHGRRCYEYLFERTQPCEDCETFTVFKTHAPHHWEWTGPNGHTYDIFDFPFTDSDGSSLIMEMGIDITEAKRAQDALRDRSIQLAHLASELTLVEQRERRRLAEVLHDDLQQLLVGAKFRLVPLERSSDPKTQKAAVDVRELLDQSIECSRSLTGDLSPPILHEGGLIAGLEWLGRWMQHKHGLRVDVHADGDDAPGPEDMIILLFQSVKELLFNAVKHAHARSAHVHVRWSDSQIEVTVADEGAGFDPAALAAKAGKGGGFGLFSVRERLDLLGGKMEIDSLPGRGSRFKLVAPLQRQPPAQA
ncbi:MAG: PAS domain S-box protein [Planctomycetaceae bacterium]|nr:PAS domain S-box protein [Planctomycetaceae bacterium]